MANKKNKVKPVSVDSIYKKTIPQKSATPVTPQTASFWNNTRLQSYALVIFAVVLYANTLFLDFAQDDAIVITQNMFTRQGAQGIPGIFQYDTFYGFFKQAGKDNLVSGGRYRPLSLVLFAIEYQIFGEKAWIGHLVNILLFALTGWLLYRLLLKLFSYRPVPIADNAGGAFNPNIFIPFLAVLLFIAHPIHTEAVANIKGLDEILALLGSFGAVWYSLIYFEKGGVKNQVIAGVLFFMALLSKENTIMFLIATPLIYRFFTSATVGKVVQQMIPFAVSTLAFLVIRANVIKNQFGGASDEQRELLNDPFQKIVDNHYIAFSGTEKAATILFTLGKYVYLLIFPHPLTHDYYPRAVGIMDFGDWQVWLSVAVNGALIYWAIKGWKDKKIESFSILFYFATLFIVSNIIFPVGTNMAERFVYMPSVGFCLLAAVLVYRFLSRQPGLLTGAIAAILLLFSVKTMSRNLVWQDDYTLFTTDVETSPGSAKVQCSAGGKMIEKATDKDHPLPEPQRSEMIRQAIPHLQKSSEIHPLYKQPPLLMGNAYFYLQNYDSAIICYQKALALSPGFADAQKNMAVAYRDAGQYWGEQKGDVNKALTYLNKSYEMVPADAATARLLGVAYGISGNNAQALTYFGKAVELDPANAQSVYDLGSAYINSGNQPKGLELHQKALLMNPNLLKK